MYISLTCFLSLAGRPLDKGCITLLLIKKLSLKTQFWEPWGWCRPTTDSLTVKGDNKKFDNTSLEGEVVEEGTYLKRCQQQVIERALTELLLPSIDQSSDEARNSFATDLVKQLSYIETHIIAITGGSKPLGGAPAGVEGQPNKVNNRKNLRTGSAALSRRPIVATSSSPPSPAALRASMSLQLQLLLRFLPTLCTDRKQWNWKIVAKVV
ncbi:mediator of RNA polymerase II transcription subunit 12-like [Vigna angularis]|uniref:mediator of RNA polymerase II transcription subunit 12-like n=1 Tax=Phaseolus angularis TaxID=3914 RepID=UPI00080A219C|nr:mediator of RNA polymerase II transcription subunit 12-like [Vigna angularis]